MRMRRTSTSARRASQRGQVCDQGFLRQASFGFAQGRQDRAAEGSLCFPQRRVRAGLEHLHQPEVRLGALLAEAEVEAQGANWGAHPDSETISHMGLK